MGWFDWLRGTSAPIVEHPRFGRVRASHRLSGGPWLWEMLGWIDVARGRVSCTFDAGERGPDEHQERAWDEICGDIEKRTLEAAPLIAAELVDWLQKPFPTDPWQELDWEGAHLTEANGKFELNYSCRSWRDAMITVRFEERKPTLVQIDD